MPRGVYGPCRAPAQPFPAAELSWSSRSTRRPVLSCRSSPGALHWRCLRICPVFPLIFHQERGKKARGGVWRCTLEMPPSSLFRGLLQRWRWLQGRGTRSSRACGDLCVKSCQEFYTTEVQIWTERWQEYRIHLVVCGFSL